MEMNVPTGQMTRDCDGNVIFIMGKNRLKIIEHFPAEGKEVNELITDLIRHKIKEDAAKTS